MNVFCISVFEIQSGDAYTHLKTEQCHLMSENSDIFSLTSASSDKEKGSVPLIFSRFPHGCHEANRFREHTETNFQ